MPEGFRRIIYEHVLIADMVIGQHQPDGGGKGKAAVAAVRGVFLITPVRPYRGGQVVRVGKRMHREPFVADAHFRAPSRMSSSVVVSLLFFYLKEKMNSIG